MKKHRFLVRTISCALSVVIAFLNLFVFSISADDTEQVLCVTDHFSKLKYNNNGSIENRIPPNEIGTCTHLAMSMILSFYDFYWNDCFVPTREWPSDEVHDMGWEKGTYNSINNTVIETSNANPEASAWLQYKQIENDYREFAQATDIFYLQSKLFSIAESETLTGSVGIVGMLAFQVVRVLEEYLLSVGLGPEQGVEVHIEHGFPNIDNLNANRDTLFSTIKNKVQEGHPVMFLGLDNIDAFPEIIDGDDWGIYAHAMVAYGVEQINGKDDILLHTGWSNNELQYYNSTPYTKFNSAVWIEIDEEKLPHVCTDAYRDTATNQNVCACYVYSNTHPAHCSHNYHCEPKNDTYHHDICGCGVAINQTHHTFTYSTHSTTSHTKYCSLCGYSSPELHNFIIERESTQYHKKTCTLCGEEQMVSHFASRYVDYDSSYHKKYCSCGEYMGFASHIAASTGKLQSYCVYCNRSMLNPGSGGTIPGIMVNPDNPGEETE